MRRAACLALLLMLAVPVAADAQSYGGASVPPSAPTAAPAADWSARRKARDEMLEVYLAKDPVAYRWFADFPFGVSSGVPYLVLKLLPRLAPEQWGSEANFLDVVGLFVDEREPGYPIARGFGFTGLSRAEPGGAPDFAALSCGACHIGRVRLADGALRYLDGGVNTQFNLVQYRVRVAATIDKITKGAKTLDERTERATAAILDALTKAHAKDENFFYKNYSFGGKRFDARYEAEQIALFQKDAPALVRGFLIRAGLELSSFLDLLAKNYQGFEGPMTAGFGGMADATGVSVSMAFAAAKADGEAPDPQTALPPTAGLTDFMAVWEQGKRLAHWSADTTSLIDGGGQWNGNIPIPMFRNLAAELTLGLGADTDIRIAAFAERLLRDLPAPPRSKGVASDRRRPLGLSPRERSLRSWGKIPQILQLGFGDYGKWRLPKHAFVKPEIDLHREPGVVKRVMPLAALADREARANCRKRSASAEAQASIGLHRAI